MRHILFLALLILTTTVAMAKKVEGFIVFHNNDSAHVVLKLGDRRFDEVMAIDAQGKEKTYHPADIACYGYSDKQGLHVYRAKMLSTLGLKFQEVVVEGPKASLYTYTYPPLEVGETTTRIGLTFQKKDTSYLFLTNFDRTAVMRDRLEEFYGDSVNVRMFIHKQFENKIGTLTVMQDVKAVVVEANKR